MILENKYLVKAITKANYIVYVLENDIYDGSSKIKYISPNATALGINIELLNRGLRMMQDYIHPDDRRDVLETLKEAINANIDSYNHEYRMVDDSGNIYYVSNDIVIADINDKTCTVECYVRDMSAKKREKKEKKEKKRERQRAGIQEKGSDLLDIKQRAIKDRFPDVMDVFAKSYGLYTAFVNVEGRTVFAPTGPATNLGDFYDLFDTPAYKDYFKFILQRVKGSDSVVVVDRQEGGDGKLSAAPLKVDGELKGIWMLGSYTQEETELLKEAGEGQLLLADIMSDYLTKSVILDVESAKSKGAGVKLREELARQSIINDALLKINSKLIETVDEVVDETLRDVGINLDVDKIALYGFDKENASDFVLRNYWDVKGEEASDEFMNDIPSKRFSIEAELNRAEDTYYADSVNMNERAKLVLMRYNLTACITYGIYKESKLNGIIIFGISKGERKWTTDELRFTKSISVIIGKMLENAEGDDNVRKVNKHLIETYNNFNVGIFVRDTYTGEILFSNKVMNEMMGRDFVGGNSKEIMTDLHDRFDNITGMRKPFITKNKVTDWRSYIKRFDAIMDITEVTMEWINGEPASLIILRKAKDNQ